MQYRALGSSGLKVSEIALGSWRTYGTTVNRETTRACLNMAFDHGINLIDTANMYGRGAAETLLGDSLSKYTRDQYILATKVFYPMSKSDKGLSRLQIHKQLDASLARLKTDYIDLYQCHRFDKRTPLEETMHALTEVVRSGKVRFIGFSEWTAEQVTAAHAIKDTVQFVSSQPRYSMLFRKPERKIFPLSETQRIGQIVWSPLAQGILTGKYKPGQPPPPDSRGASREIGFSEVEVLEAVQKLRPIALDLGISTPQLALAWVLNNSLVTAAIIGASNSTQLEHNLRATTVTLDVSTLQAIDVALAHVVRK